MRRTVTVLSLFFVCGLSAGMAATRVVNNIPFVPTCPAGYATIQAAVNAASANDVVYVCASAIPYAEQVTITKPLTLAGQTGADIQPGPVTANTTSLFDASPIAAVILVSNTANVTVSGLIVDGTGNAIGDCATDFIGIFYRNASGTVVNNAVRKIQLGSGLEGCQSGLGIFVQSGGGNSVVAIRANSVHDFQKNGITGNEIGTSLTVSGNTVTGWGPTPFIAQNGIQLAYGATGTISANNVTNVVYSQCVDVPTCTYSSTGILIYGPVSGITTSGNNIGTTQTGVYYYDAANGSIANNKIWNTLVWDGIAVYGDTTDVGGGNTISGNVVTDSGESGVWINTDGNQVNSDTINETPIGIWFAGGASSQSANKFYNTATTVKTGTSLAARQGQLKVKPAR